MRVYLRVYCNIRCDLHERRGSQLSSLKSEGRLPTVPRSDNSSLLTQWNYIEILGLQGNNLNITRGPVSRTTYRDQEKVVALSHGHTLLYSYSNLIDIDTLREFYEPVTYILSTWCYRCSLIDALNYVSCIIRVM